MTDVLDPEFELVVVTGSSTCERLFDSFNVGMALSRFDASKKRPWATVRRSYKGEQQWFHLPNLSEL